MIAGLRAGTAVERGVALAVLAAEAAAAASVAVLAGLLVWTLAAPGSAVPSAPPLSLAAGGDDAPRAARDWSVLWTADPFRSAGAAPSEAAEDAPETTLNLVLMGVRTPSGDAPGAAYIKTPDNRQGAYRPGQEIIPGVTLEAVLADRVALTRSGARETLYLDGARRQAAAAPAPAAAAGAAPVLSPEDFMDAAEFRAVSRDGRVLGLRVVDVRNPGLMQRIGLRQEDIVLEIGGRSLASAGDPAAALERARRAGRVELIVERNGARMPLTLEFESLQ